ncbi:MAG: HAD family hydrolase [Synechococcus sp. SB0678_bin_12]|nr:HAD family hydrolase [Synechococcus sp. SB0678_bin_12]MYI87690.1 HAD family hydrolase [Synechococcus sp. SB0672_bin_10]
MVWLQIGPQRFGPLRAILLDKDGTLSNSEAFLMSLAEARLATALQQVPAGLRPQLTGLLQRAYGLLADQETPSLDPGGATAVASAGHNLISTATCLAQVGLSWSEALAKAQVIHGQPLDDHLSRAELTPPLSGVRQLLRRAQDLGLPCGIISGDCRQGIEDFLRHWGLLGAITVFRGSDQLPAKPAAQAALHLCRDLGVDPQHCLLCGDSGQDLAMARAAGVGVVVGYTGGWRNSPRLQGFDALVADWGAVTLLASTSST